MNLATIKFQGRELAVLADQETGNYLPLGAAGRLLFNSDVPDTMLELIEMEPEFTRLLEELEKGAAGGVDELWINHDHAELAAPIPRPRKNIFCVGKNYAEHAIEMGSEEDIPEHVMLFSKAPTTVIGPERRIPSHEGVTEALDYEGELAVIIGKTGKGISRDEAFNHVFGYTILNDVTARDLQARHKQFFLGKSLDGTCPMGPFIKPKKHLTNPGSLSIETKVNGETRQKSSTEHFIFTIEEIIEVISKGMTLEAGDIIATGTPAGVGKGFNPPRFLKSGDQVEITIGGLGTLRNTVQ
ncbi:fumarylacetoacetate hydrolase family protein [Peribacillus sp. SCS-37]|uniref:fumarylacetoacetate hydrolase family protein n=1 Tax=Paraperibacillus esterisolvens TaxID=3115296 RepID=UPI0039060EE1